MAIFGSLATVRAQAPAGPAFAAAWNYLDELRRDGSDVGKRIRAFERGASQKHELAAGVFAIEQVYDTKPRSEGFFESHRRYIDIQVIVAGEEIMEVADAGRAAVRQPYQDARDLIEYHDVPAASKLTFRAGEAAIFFPVDVHMPSLRAGTEPALVRKVVLKVPVSA